MLLLPQGPSSAHLQGKQPCQPTRAPCGSVPDILPCAGAGSAIARGLHWDPLFMERPQSLITRVALRVAAVTSLWGRGGGSPAAPPEALLLPKSLCRGPPGTNPPFHPLSLQWAFAPEQEKHPGPGVELRLGSLGTPGYPKQLKCSSQPKAVPWEGRIGLRAGHSGLGVTLGVLGHGRGRLEWPQVVLGTQRGFCAAPSLPGSWNHSGAQKGHWQGGKRG